MTSIPAATQVRGTVTRPPAQTPTRFPEHAFAPPAPAVLEPPVPAPPALAPPPPRPLPAEPPTLEPPTLEPPTLEPPTLEPPTLEPPTPEPPTLEPLVAIDPAAPPLDLPPAVSIPAEPVGSAADAPPQAAPVIANGSGALSSTSRRMSRRKWRSFMKRKPCTARASRATARYLALFATNKPVSHNQSAPKLAQIEPASGRGRQPSAARAEELLARSRLSGEVQHPAVRLQQCLTRRGVLKILSVPMSLRAFRRFARRAAICGGRETPLR